VFLGFSHAPYPKGTGYQRAKNFSGPSTCLHTVYEKQLSNFAWWSDYVRENNILQVDHATCSGHTVLLTGFPDARCVSVASLLLFKRIRVKVSWMFDEYCLYIMLLVFCFVPWSWQQTLKGYFASRRANVLFLILFLIL